MTKFEYFSMARRLWRGFESVTRVRALVVCLLLAALIILSSHAAAAGAEPSVMSGYVDHQGSGAILAGADISIEP